MFEIKFTYLDKKTDGPGYLTEPTQSFSKRLGKQATDEVDDQQLASLIICQLARRDIMIIDVEIVEYVRRKVSFKETKGGIIVRNKKFLFESGFVSQTEEAPPVQPATEPAPQPTESKPVQAIRFEIFDPEPGMVASLQAKGRLTPGQKYAILEERTVAQRANAMGQITSIPMLMYAVQDDAGSRVVLPSLHFRPIVPGNHGQPAGSQRTNQVVDPSMPVLRR